MVAACEDPSSAGTEPPKVEHAHRRHMMENPEPTETEEELSSTERQQEEEAMRGGGSGGGSGEDNLPTEEDEQ
jgi:hypothetical protein